MKPSSAKQKGRSGQQEARDMILVTFPELQPDDVRSNPMGAPGEDLLLSPAARKLLGGIQIEVKRSSRIAMMRWVEQAQQHGKHIPVVWFREDKCKIPYVTMPATHYLYLMRDLVNCIQDATDEDIIS